MNTIKPLDERIDDATGVSISVNAMYAMSRDEAAELRQALADSNLALLEQTQLAERCRQQAETAEAENARLVAQIATMQHKPQPHECAPCKGINCGATDGVSHSVECAAEHAAVIAGGRFVPKGAAPTVKQFTAQLGSDEKWTIAEQKAFAPFLAQFPNESSQGILSLGSAWKHGIAYAQSLAAAPQQHAQAALSDVNRCEHCDGSGLVHRPDGTFLGTCGCIASQQPAAAQEPYAYFVESVHADGSKTVISGRKELIGSFPLYAAAPAIQQEGAALDERAARIADGLAVLCMDYSAQVQCCASTESYVQAAVEQLVDAGWRPRAALAAPARAEVVPDPRPLFERKLADLQQRGYEVIGRILHKDGEYALFDSSCRWLTKPQYQRLMHEQDSSLFAAPSPAQVQPVAVPRERLQNWIDVIHDNERSMGDRLQSLSSIFGGLLRGDALDKYPLQTIREQQPDSGRDAALGEVTISRAASDEAAS